MHKNRRFILAALAIGSIALTKTAVQAQQGNAGEPGNPQNIVSTQEGGAAGKAGSCCEAGSHCSAHHHRHHHHHRGEWHGQVRTAPSNTRQ